MVPKRSHLEAQLHAAESALESARERRSTAEQALWDVVRRSRDGGPSTDETEAARRDYGDARRALVEADLAVKDLRDQLADLRERENRLMAVTDALIARDRSRSRADTRETDQRARSRRSLLDLFRRR
jgi:predicted  nucleic acid-binding Zn-ribbon protein